MSRLPDFIRERLMSLESGTPHIDVPSTEFYGADHMPREAAVMIALCAPDAQPCVVLTRRAMHLSAHAGEYSFPGGSLDPDDVSLLAAAQRECHEEVGLPPESLDVFGFLASVPTLSNFQIAAFVAAFDHRTPMHADPGEVQHIALTPLRALTAPGVHRVTMQTHGKLTVPIHAFHLDPAQPIWGATAYLLHELLRYVGLDYA